MDVFIPTYNSGKTLRVCLESIIREIPNPRIIVVDRYSTDDTIKIASEFNCEIYFTYKGVGHSRQIGYSKCKTEWIASIDSDIVLHKNWYNDMSKFIDDDVGVIEGLHVLTCISEYILSLYRRGYKKEFEEMKIYRELKKGERGAPGNALIRLDALRGLKLPDVEVYEDWLISNHVLEKGYRWLFAPVLSDHIATLSHALKKERWNAAGARKVAGITFSQMLTHFYRNSIMGCLETVRMRSVDPLKFRVLFPINMLIGYIFADRFYYMKR